MICKYGDKVYINLGFFALFKDKQNDKPAPP